MGIEPTRPAWKAGVLPLNYTRTGAEVPNISHKIIAYHFQDVNKNFGTNAVESLGQNTFYGEHRNSATAAHAETAIKALRRRTRSSLRRRSF